MIFTICYCTWNFTDCQVLLSRNSKSKSRSFPPSQSLSKITIIPSKLFRHFMGALTKVSLIPGDWRCKKKKIKDIEYPYTSHLFPSWKNWMSWICHCSGYCRWARAIEFGLCGKSFYREPYLDMHMASKHSQALAKVPQKEQRKIPKTRSKISKYQ